MTKLPTTVFTKLPKESSANSHVAATAHRAAVVIYAMYFTWALLTFIGDLPTIANATSDSYQTLFSGVVALVTLPAAIGALFFPKLARLEMYAGAAFASLMLIYLFFLGAAALDGDLNRFANFVIISSVIVMPVARCLFVIRQLVRTEELHTGDIPTNTEGH